MELGEQRLLQKTRMNCVTSTDVVESNNGGSCLAVLVRMLDSWAMHYKLHVNNEISVDAMSDACT